MLLLIIACLAGIYLGASYRITILIPVTIATCLACVAAAFINDQSLPATLISIAISTVSLQGGYMLGLTSRDALNQVFVALANYSRNEFR